MELDESINRDPVSSKSDTQNLKSRRLIPVTKWNEHHDWPPIGGLRHLIFHAASNGFDKVVKRVGRRCVDR